MVENSKTKINAGTFMVRYTLGNHQATLEYWRNQAQEIVNELDAPSLADQRTAFPTDSARKRLAERLRRLFPITAPLHMWQLPKNVLVSWLAEVNWNNVADHVFQGMQCGGDRQ